MKNDFIIAIAQLSAEKNLDSNTVFEAVEAAMASAFKKDELQYADIEVKIDVQDGDIAAWRRYLVMPDDEIEDDEIQVSPERAKAMGFPNAQVGDYVREPARADRADRPHRRPDRQAGRPPAPARGGARGRLRRVHE